MRLTLDDAVNVALRHNFDLRLSRHGLASSQSSVLAAENRFDFKLTTSLTHESSYQRNRARLDPDLPRDYLDDDQALVLQLDKRVRWGGAFDVTTILRRDHFNTADIDPDHIATYSLSYEQPLWGGRGRRYATADLVGAKTSYLQATRSLAVSEANLVVRVTQSFHDVLRQRQLITINEGAAERAEARRRTAALRLEEGLITPIEEKRAERDLRARQNDVIAAQEGYEGARDRFLLLLGLPLDRRFELVSDLRFEPVRVDLDEALDEALAQRADVRNQVDQLELAELSVHVARSNKRPDLDVKLTASYDNVEGDELSKYFDISNQDTWTAELTFSHVFGDRSDDEALVRALIAEERARIDLQELERSVSLEVRDAVRNLASLERQVEVLERNVELAQESLELATLQFTEGLISTTDLLADQSELVSAETARVNALAQHAVARVNLELVLGRYRTLGDTGRSEFLRDGPAPPVGLERYVPAPDGTAAEPAESAGEPPEPEADRAPGAHP